MTFFEVYVNTPLEICEQRDPKGLYAKARAGSSPTSQVSVPSTRHRGTPTSN